ncbi:hypothetical protein [Planomicrobium sp. CPCC 101110]|uniref:hypothetical protein n=1 Tax=Planomicrobium sp. CPCC 101110 TaxID=2599619 RepID=UPI0011B69DDC|nr:hypothetical protein [Planomicrobium sp. CPCC 101110]TWT25235.1 hypothetical protein FQV30_12770 [Planomicrobium sp. CPCC 101110]
MPADQKGADKRYLFIFMIFSTLALDEGSVKTPLQNPDPGPSEAYVQEAGLLKNTGDHIPSEPGSETPVRIEKENEFAISAKRMKSRIGMTSGLQLELAHAGIHTDSAIGYFMRDFNRLWDVYWVAVWTKEDDLTSEDVRNMKALAVEYEELRRFLKFSMYDSSGKMPRFQEEFMFSGDSAIRYRIQATRHAMTALESGKGMATSLEINKTIERINTGVARSNKEVEKLNVLYAGHLHSWSNSAAKQRKGWTDDFSQNYVYKGDR